MSSLQPSAGFLWLGAGRKLPREHIVTHDAVKGIRRPVKYDPCSCLLISGLESPACRATQAWRLPGLPSLPETPYFRFA